MKILETLGEKIGPKISIGVLGSGSWATALVKILTDSKNTRTLVCAKPWTGPKNKNHIKES